MRMAADQFGGDRLDDVAKVEMPFFLGHLRMKDDLQQQVAKFVPQVREIAALDGVGDLIGFFDGKRDDALKSLLEVPRAAEFRAPKGGHDVEQRRDLAPGNWAEGKFLPLRLELGRPRNGFSWP